MLMCKRERRNVSAFVRIWKNKQSNLTDSFCRFTSRRLLFPDLDGFGLYGPVGCADNHTSLNTPKESRHIQTMYLNVLKCANTINNYNDPSLQVKVLFCGGVVEFA